MGVKGCNRKGCNSIICDRYSSTYGYICNNCFIELQHNIARNIVDFLASDKKDDMIKKCWLGYLEEEFKIEK